MAGPSRGQGRRQGFGCGAVARVYHTLVFHVLPLRVIHEGRDRDDAIRGAELPAARIVRDHVGRPTLQSRSGNILGEGLSARVNA